MIKSIIKKLFFKIISPAEILATAESHYLKRIQKDLILGEGSKVYKEARILNHKNKRESIHIGCRTHIRGELLTFAYGGQIEIGDDCFIGEGTRIWSGDSIKIGNNVLISHNCNVVDTNSHELDHLERAAGYRKLVTEGHPKQIGSIIANEIVIEDYAWISFQVTILKGIRIGKGAIVAAGSVVTKDVDPFTMVAGNPAVFIRKL